QRAAVVVAGGHQGGLGGGHQVAGPVEHVGGTGSRGDVGTAGAQLLAGGNDRRRSGGAVVGSRRDLDSPLGYQYPGAPAVGPAGRGRGRSPSCAGNAARGPGPPSSPAIGWKAGREVSQNTSRRQAAVARGPRMVVAKRRPREGFPVSGGAGGSRALTCSATT